MWKSAKKCEKVPRRSCPLQGGPGSVRFGYGLEMERFKRFRFSVPAVPLQKGFFYVFQYSLTGKDGSGFGFGKTVPAVPVPLSVSGKTVPAVPVRFLSHPAFIRISQQCLS